MRIIPAIDIIGGQCVRLSMGDYQSKKIYAENPLEIAKKFEQSGIRFLHLVDLDGAKAKHIININVLENITGNTAMAVDFGGGIKTAADAELAFSKGASQITLGSVAAGNPEFCREILQKYGAEKIILGADCLGRKIKTSGWQEDSGLDVLDFIKNYEKDGFRYVACTDISKDGMLTGPSLALYEEILAETRVKLIASGGISSVEDLQALKKIGCFGAIIGKAIYEGKISLKDLKKFMENA